MLNNNEFHKPKLLVITSIYPNNIEPHSGKFNEQQVVMLKRFFEIQVISPVPWFPLIHLFEKKAEFSKSGQVHKTEERNGITLYHPRQIIIPKIARSLYGFLYLFSILGLAIKIYKKFRFDAIFGTWVYPDGFATVLLSKIFKKPVLLKVHGSDINDYTRYFIRRKMIIYALKNSHKVIAVSNDLKQKMMNIGIPENKVRIIYNGVNRDIFNPWNIIETRAKLNLPLDKKIILFIGTLKPVKGLTYLIDAFHILSSNIDDLILIIIGGGIEEGVLREKIENYGIRDRVIMTGVKEHQDIPLWLNACDLFCLPSLSEGVPNVILEALSCNKPVVATNVGGIPEVITSQECGILVNPKDSKALAEALKDALTRKWNYDKISDYARGFSWQRNAELLSQELSIAIQEHCE